MSSAFRRRQTKPRSKETGETSHLKGNGDRHVEADGRIDGSVSDDGRSPPPRNRPLSLPGVKPWIGGIHLTSTGLNDLDAILGGGQPLGTCILLQEDRWCKDLALSLVKYWCAEAISQRQTLCVPTARQDNHQRAQLHDDPLVENTFDGDQFNRWLVRDLLETLPRNLHWDKDASKSKRGVSLTDNNTQPPPSLGLAVLDEHEGTEEGEWENDGEAYTDEGLKNAWQYRTSVQQERLKKTTSTASSTSLSKNRSTGSKHFCHSYDLSGRMSDQIDVKSADVSLDIDRCIFEPSPADGTLSRFNGTHLFRDLVAIIVERLHMSKNARGGITDDGLDGSTVVRLLLHHLPVSELAVAVPLVLSFIRQRRLPVVLMVCVTPSDIVSPAASTSSWTSLQQSVDVVLRTEGFASRSEYPPPAEFRHLHGILTIRKLNTVTAATANGGGHFADLTTSKRPAAYTYGFKRDRRKLHIPLLHIPPEDYAEGGGSVGSGGVRSGAGRPPSNSAGMGCASNLEGSALDF